MKRIIFLLLSISMIFISLTGCISDIRNKEVSNPSFKTKKEHPSIIIKNSVEKHKQIWSPINTTINTDNQNICSLHITTNKELLSTTLKLNEKYLFKPTSNGVFVVNKNENPVAFITLSENIDPLNKYNTTVEVLDFCVSTNNLFKSQSWQCNKTKLNDNIDLFICKYQYTNFKNIILEISGTDIKILENIINTIDVYSLVAYNIDTLKSINL